MKRNIWFAGLLAVLLVLPACNQPEEPTEGPPDGPQQQSRPEPAQTPSEQPAQTPSELAAPTAGAMPMTGPMAAGDVPLGEKIYRQACRSCHDQGVAGAPKTGDQAAWVERIAKGMETLVSNSVNGFSGEAGMMPAKGGDPSLSAEEVEAAVEYMVLQSQ